MLQNYFLFLIKKTIVISMTVKEIKLTGDVMTRLSSEAYHRKSDWTYTDSKDSALSV